MSVLLRIIALGVFFIGYISVTGLSAAIIAEPNLPDHVAAEAGEITAVFDVFVDAQKQGGRIDVQIEIDLENRTIDLVAAPQAKLEKFLSMSTPITVTGPWDDMQIGVGGAGFIGTLFRWYMSLIYVPYKWITGERFPEDGLETCFASTDWEYVSD